MFKIALVRRLLSCAAIAAVTLLAFAGAAQARAVSTPIESHEDLSGTTTLPECLPADLIGVQSGTEDTVGALVETNSSVHLRATTTLNYRVDFPDGSYVIGTATEQFTFSSTRADNPFVSTTTVIEPATIYDAAGSQTGTIFLHFHGHITAFDANGNGAFDGGEVITNFDQLKFTCR